MPSSTLGDLLDLSDQLTQTLDPLIESATDSWAQQHADWAWFRFGSITMLIRQEGGGLVAAALARGLLEQAAYWDWALANGAGIDHIAHWAAIEYARLEQLGKDVGDTTWIGWVLPPGTELASDGADGIPVSPAEAVKRLGAGLATPVLLPMQFRGLFAANRLLDVLAHGNLVAAQIMAAGGGAELSAELAAAILHVASASTAATVIALLEPDEKIRQEITDLTQAIATMATDLHGLPLGPPAQPRRAAKAHQGTPFARRSDIQFMPQAAETISHLGQRFVHAAERLGHEAVNRLRPPDTGTVIGWNSFQLAYANLLVLSGACSGQLGRALLPAASRALLEDGARWAWIRREVAAEPTGDTLRAVVADAQRYLVGIRNSMISDGVPATAFDALVGKAASLLHAEPGDGALPPIEEMLSAAYPTAYGIDSTRPMYSVLSQFVHATPLSVLHLQRDEFTSLSAPTFAIAVEAACRGFASIARGTIALSCDPSVELEEAFADLDAALVEVVRAATGYHFLG